MIKTTKGAPKMNDKKQKELIKSIDKALKRLERLEKRMNIGVSNAKSKIHSR